MVSSGRQAIACILVVLGAAVCVQTQTATQKVASASISGKVTIKGKPAVGVMVLADEPNAGGNLMSRRRAKTDQTGSYRITNLTAGTYEISTITPVLVPANQSDSIVVSEGEEVENVNLVLVPGGVITGKITDADGEPVIGEQVNIMPVSEQLTRRIGHVLTQLYSTGSNSTDDRGVYRMFGLPPGKYKVSVGQSESGFGRRGSREYYKEMFYPSVTDAAKATIIEVTEGSVTNDVNIVLGRSIGTFRVVGRVVDGETGRPIPNLRYGVGQTIKHDQNSSGSSSSMTGEVTNANGEFRLENVTAGTYTIFTAPEGGDVPVASVTFDVVDRDVTDLVIKTIKGGSLSGVVVLDGSERAPAMLTRLRICASVKSRHSGYANSPSSAVAQDGTFKIDGVRSGLVNLWLCSSDKGEQFETVRVERNGTPQSEINVKEGELVAGIRVVVKYVKLTGGIRGQVKASSGELPPISQLRLSLWPLDENLEPQRSHSIGSPELDSRGRFLLRDYLRAHID